jgi:hypothetical protein
MICDSLIDNYSKHSDMFGIKLILRKAACLLFMAGITGVCSAQFHYESPPTWQKQYQKKNEPEKKQGFVFDKSKLTFGGGVGLQFGDYTLVNIAPQAGYNFTKRFNAGLGFSYTYWKDRFYYNGDNYRESCHYLGFNVYGRLYPLDFLVLQLQPEINRVWQRVENSSTGVTAKDEKFVPVLLAGAGIRMGPVTFMLQYDLIQNDRSPYGKNIFYGMGYVFGL